MAVIYNIWFSPVYHTRELCRELGAAIGKNLPGSLVEDHDFTDYNAPENPLAFCRDDVAVLAAPVYVGRIPAVFAEKLSALQGNGAKAVLLASYGNRAFEDALAELANVAEKAGFKPFAACACIARHTIAQACAQGRPDGNDLGEVRNFGLEIAQFLTAGAREPVLAVPGNVPDKTAPRFPLPQTVNENCVRCGICQEKCPLHAIDFNDPRLVDPQKCISCMRCIALCPENAREPNPEFIAAVAKKLEPVCETPKCNEFFGLNLSPRS